MSTPHDRRAYLGIDMNDGVMHLDDERIAYIAERMIDLGLVEAKSEPEPIAAPVRMRTPASVDDLRDAADIISTLRHLLGLNRDANDSRVRLLMRWTIDLLWDTPRKTVQGKRKYAGHALWSPAASRQAAKGNYGDLIDEHVVPFAVQVEDVLSKLDGITPEAMAELLDAYPRAIVTRAEAAQIDVTSGRSTMPDGWREVSGGEWLRYTKAGLDPSTFAPYAKTECGAIDHDRVETVRPCHKAKGHTGKHTGKNESTGRGTSW